MKKLDAHAARDVLDDAHMAWSKGDMEQVLGSYADDLVYWCNAGSLEGKPMVIEGKAQFRTFLYSISAVVEGKSTTDYFQFDGGVARASITCYIRHRRTGLIMSGSYRQVATFSGRRIARMEEFHDAAKFAAFWRLVTCEETLQMAAET